MVTFLFWNMNREARLEVLARLVERHGIDVLVLAECTARTPDLCDALNSGGRAAFHPNPGVRERVQIFSVFDPEQIREIRAGARYTIRHLQIPARPDVLLAAAHLPSKLHQSEHSHRYRCGDFADAIRTRERELGHRRTLAVGDFNMNPFEPSMMAAKDFHAVMDRRIAKKEGRKVDGIKYPYFYNPMWSLLGDASPGPPGTYYRASGEHVNYFWNMLDQVLVRPDLLTKFRNEDLEILTTDGTADFLTPSGVPNRTTASDHLPLLFRVDL